MFSFNNPYGACPECGGIGTRYEIDPDAGRAEPRAVARRTGALAPWAGPPGPRSSSRRSRVLAKRHKFNLETPWAKLPKKARDVILHGERGRRLRGRGQDARAPLPGDARPRRRARRSSTFMALSGLPGLRRLAAAAGDAGGQDRGPLHRRRRAASPSRRRASSSTRSRSDRARDGDRAPRAEGDPRAPGLPRQRRARLPDARPPGGHAVGRRGAAHPPGHPDRLEPGRRALHPGRAVDRPAPARQRPAPRHAQAPARPRQHRARRRARRGDDPRRRLRRRPGPGRGRARRPHGRGGHARRDRWPTRPR